MDLKLYLSKSSVKLLDECVGELDSWHFDAINDPILLQVLIETEKSFIGEYLTNENIEKDEFEIFVPSYLANRTNKLLIKEGEKFDGMTQEEAAKRFPNNHVPDSDMDDDDDDDEEDEDEFEDGLDESDESEESDNPSQDEEDDKQDDDAEKDPEGTSSDEPKEDESQKEPEATESTSPSEEKPEDKPKDNAPKGDGSQFITMKVKDGKLLDVKISDTDPSKPVAVEEKKKPTPMKPASTTKPQYRSEHIKDVVLFDGKMREHWYPASQEFLNVVNAILEIAEELGITEIEPVHFAVALFRLDSISVKEFFRDLDLSYLKAKRFFTNTSLSKVGIIPADISSFLTCLQDKVDITKPCQILMRDKEVSMIWNISMKMNKRNTVIVGEAGVGKSALIEKVTYDIVTGKAPKRFKNFVVLSLDVNSLIAGTTYRGDAEKRIKGLIEFLEKHDNVILFIDEVHTILGAGSCYEGEMDLANALKPMTSIDPQYMEVNLV